MPRHKRLLTTVAAAGGAVLIMAASTLVMSAGGGTIGQRVTAPSLPAASMPPQQVTGIDCSAINGGCDLYAKPGTSNGVPIWGFSPTSSGQAAIPGPTIVAAAGQVLRVTVHNAVAAGPLAIDWPSVAIADRSDRTVAVSQSVTTPTLGVSTTADASADNVGVSKSTPIVTDNLDGSWTTTYTLTVANAGATASTYTLHSAVGGTTPVATITATAGGTANPSYDGVSVTDVSGAAVAIAAASSHTYDISVVTNADDATSVENVTGADSRRTYQLTVHNNGASSQSYRLDSVITAGPTARVSLATASSGATTNAGFDGSTDTAVTTDSVIAGGADHVFDIVVDAPTGAGSNQTVTTPMITVTQANLAGGLVSGNNYLYSYDLIVDNADVRPTSFDLSSAITPAAGLTVGTVTVTGSGASATFNGSSNQVVAAQVALAGSASTTYHVEVNATSSGSASSFPSSIAEGGQATYLFTVRQPGTSVYRAGGGTPHAARQAAMGLSGVLVVRPGDCAAGKCAYGNPASTTGLNGGSSLGYDVATDQFDDEALVVTNDLDPVFAADPLHFEMTAYHPTVHLINGRAFPDTEVIDSQPGHKVLLRYANLGLADHSMALVGTHQRIVGRDSHAIAHGSDDVVIPLNTGQTVDATVSVPLSASAGFRYPLNDEAREPGQLSADAAMTFVAVWTDVVTNPTKPATQITLVSPADSAGDSDINLAGTTSLQAGSSTPVNAVVVSIDVPSTTGISATLSSGGSVFNATVPAATAATLTNGDHTLWAMASDDGGVTFGDPAGVAFTIDRNGPAVYAVATTPVYTNGDQPVQVTATGDASLTGTGLVHDAAALVDSCPAASGPGTIPVVVNPLLTPGTDTVIADLAGTISVATLGGLADGDHTVNVTAQDNRGVWTNSGGSPTCGSATFTVDRTAPDTVAASILPGLTNDGTQAFNGPQSFLKVVRITATVDDAVSGVGKVEGFLDEGTSATAPTPAQFGTGFLFTAADGLFDSTSEPAYADIPLAAIASLTDGGHAIFIHGQDRAGNWAGFGAPSVTLTKVSAGPVVNVISYDPTVGSEGASVSVSTSGVGVTLTRVDYAVGTAAPAVWVDSVPASGSSTTVFVPVTLSLTDPTQTLWVRAVDSQNRVSAVKAMRWPTTTTPNISLNRRTISGTASIGDLVQVGLQQVEYSLNTAAAPGTGINIPLAPASIGAASANYSITRPVGSALPHGTVVYVRVRANGIWGLPVSVVVP